MSVRTVVGATAALALLVTAVAVSSFWEAQRGRHDAAEEAVSPRDATLAELAALRSAVQRVRRQLHDLPPDDGLGRHDAAAGTVASRVVPPRKPRSTSRRVSVVAHPPLTEDHDTIFVSIASFRDAICAPTLVDLFKKAKNPRRVFAGVAEQNSDDDAGCMPPSFQQCVAQRAASGKDGVNDDGFCPTDNVRIREITQEEAKGPCFGRHVAMLMYRGEKYFMLIDSHNVFLRHWDSNIIRQHRDLPTHPAVISNYPPSWEPHHDRTDDPSPSGHIIVMCSAHFLDKEGYLRLDGQNFARSGRPRLQPYAAAGFLFSDASLVHDVPFDPYLDYLFDGEEILYAARMWTHGYDLYAPATAIMFHHYVRNNAQKVWSVPNNRWWVHQALSIDRVRYFLNVTKKNEDNLFVTHDKMVNRIAKDAKRNRVAMELEKYGLGHNRTLQQYWEFAGVDPNNRKFKFSFCSKKVT